MVAVLSSRGQMGEWVGGSFTQFTWTDRAGGGGAGGSCTQFMWTDGVVDSW